MHTVRLKPLLANLGIALGTGLLSGLATMGSKEVYATLRQPPLAPPGWLFPIVWTVLFTLMGISAYRVWVTASPARAGALRAYALQLALNALWPVLFFNLRAFLPALAWLLALLAVIVVMVARFARVDRLAARLQIPYLVWTLFAAYLNTMIWLLNP